MSPHPTIGQQMQYQHNQIQWITTAFQQLQIEYQEKIRNLEERLDRCSEGTADIGHIKHEHQTQMQHLYDIITSYIREIEQIITSTDNMKVVLHLKLNGHGHLLKADLQYFFDHLHTHTHTQIHTHTHSNTHNTQTSRPLQVTGNVTRVSKISDNKYRVSFGSQEAAHTLEQQIGSGRVVSYRDKEVKYSYYRTPMALARMKLDKANAAARAGQEDASHRATRLHRQKWQDTIQPDSTAPPTDKLRALRAIAMQLNSPDWEGEYATYTPEPKRLQARCDTVRMDTHTHTHTLTHTQHKRAALHHLQPPAMKCARAKALFAPPRASTPALSASQTPPRSWTASKPPRASLLPFATTPASATSTWWRGTSHFSPTCP